MDGAMTADRGSAGVKATFVAGVSLIKPDALVRFEAVAQEPAQRASGGFPIRLGLVCAVLLAASWVVSPVIFGYVLGGMASMLALSMAQR